LSNSAHYKSKIINFEIPHVKLSDIWVKKDTYDFFKQNIDKYDFEKHKIRTSRVKNLYDNMVFKNVVEASEYYTDKGFRLSKGSLWKHMRDKSILRFTKEFEFVYVD
jgi:hypothetical protein